MTTPRTITGAKGTPEGDAVTVIYETSCHSYLVQVPLRFVRDIPDSTPPCVLLAIVEDQFLHDSGASQAKRVALLHVQSALRQLLNEYRDPIRKPPELGHEK